MKYQPQEPQTQVYPLRVEMRDRRVSARILAAQVDMQVTYLYKIINEDIVTSYDKAQKIIKAVESFNK